MQTDESPAVQHLLQLGIPHRIFVHSSPVNSLEQAAHDRSQLPEQVIRSLVFRISDGEFIMVLMPGPGQVPWKNLRRFLNLSRVTMATADEVFSATGCRPGTVNPLATTIPMRILVEQRILSLPEVSLGSCLRGLAIIISPSDLLKALPNFEIVDFQEE